jgi:hypothetical protein
MQLISPLHFVYNHPDIEAEDGTQVVVYQQVCDTCIEQLTSCEYTALDIIVMEITRLNYEKEHDYSE